MASFLCVVSTHVRFLLRSSQGNSDSVLDGNCCSKMTKIAINATVTPSLFYKEYDDMATMNVSLPDQMKTWVESQSQSGCYSNASDYVRDLIRRDQDHRHQLVEALIAGEQSGDSTLSVNEIWAKVKNRSS